MAFKLTNGRATAQQLAEKRVALLALELRTEAVKAAPVDTGRLRASIGLKKIPGGWRVGTNVQYALWVEYGTRHTRAQPFMRPAAEKVKNRG